MNMFNNSRKPEEEVNPTQFSPFHAVVGLLGFAISLGNLLSLVSLFRCKRMAKQIRSLSLSLAATDIMTGIFLILNPLIRLMGAEDYPPACFFELIIPRFTSFLSVFTITAFALDRCMSLSFAITYVKYVTTFSSCVVSSVLWIMSVTLTVLSFSKGFTYRQNCIMFNQVQGTGFLCSVALACAIIVIGCYSFIYKVVRQHALHIQPSSSDNNDGRKRSARQYRATVKISTIALSFVALFSPIAFYKTYVYFNPESWKVTYSIRQVMIIVYILNSWINPFLYAWRFRECRSEVLKILFCWSKERVEAIRNAQKQKYVSYLN